MGCVLDVYHKRKNQIKLKLLGMLVVKTFKINYFNTDINSPISM